MSGLFARTLASSPDKPVIFDDHRGWITVGGFEAETRRLARRLTAAGLRAGDRVVMSAAPSIALAVADVAALRLGLVVVPMNPAYRSREIGHVVGDARPKAVVSDSPDRARLVEEAAGDMPILTIAIDGEDLVVPPGTGHAEAMLDGTTPGDPALLVYTSGTTGQPKGALLSHGNLVAGCEAVRTAWQWTPEDRLVSALPLFHVHGLGIGLQGTLAVGGSVVLRARFDAQDVGEAIERHSATMLFGVPTMYARLAAEPRLRRLRLCVSGSAPLPAELHRRFEEGTGQRIVERYGMTETLMIASNPYEGERRPGTVGFPLPGVGLRLGEVRDDGSGEILVRGPNVFGGYWERPEATETAFEDGWFRTGDVGAFDADGYLRIVGRKTDLVISGGFNVYPREVEDVLREHPGVADAAVVGWPDAEWGEQVVAFVERAPGASVTEAELIAFTLERLAPYKRPKVVRFVPELPRNALGKTVKADLGPDGVAPAAGGA